MATTHSGNKVELQVGVDVSPMKQGLREGELEIKKFGDTVATQASKASRSIDSLGTASQDTSAKLSRSQQAYLANLQRIVAAAEAGGRDKVEYQRKLAALRNMPAEFSEPLLKQLEAIQNGQAGAGKGLADFQQNLRATRVQANLTANALRQVPAQFTDIVVSLASGQAPLTVLLQQGGQLKDVFGGVGAAVRALGGYVLGLLNPFTILAAVVGALVLGYKQAADEQQEFLKALVLTGNAAGTTVNALSALASKIGDTTELSTGQAAELVSAFAAAGVAVNKIEEAALVAFRLQRDAGIATEETVRNFAELGKDPLTAVVKLNQSMRFLTVETYQQIKALTEQGRTAEATAIAQQAFLDAGRTRSAELTKNLDNITLAYRAATEGARNFGNAFLEAFRPQTSEKFEQKLRQDIANIEQALSTGRSDQALPVEARRGGRAGQEAVLESLREQLRLLERVNTQEAERARALGASADNANKLAAFDKDFASLVKDAQSAEQQIAAATKRTKELVKIGLDPARAKRYIDALRASLADKGQDDRKNHLDLGIEEIKARLAESISVLDSQQKVFEARRQAGLVGEQDYYEKIGGLITQRSNLEIGATEDIIKLRQRTTLNDKDAIDNQREIVKLTAERTKQVREANTQGQVLSIQEQAAAVARVRAYEQARNAAQTFFDAQDLGFKREIDGLNRGDLERRRIAGVNQISDRYAEQRRAASERLQLASLAGPPTAEARQQYDQQVALIDEFLGKSLESWDRYYADLKTAQADWTTGAKRSLENYSDSVANVAGQTESLLTNAFKGAEDALVQFVTTGKSGVAELVNGILADLTRLAIRRSVTGLLAQGFANLFSNTSDVGPVIPFGATPSAKGNVFASADLSRYSNGVYDTPKTFAFAKGAGVFAEAGPEAIMPLTRTPDGNLGVRATGGSTEVVINNYSGQPVSQRQTQDGRGGRRIEVSIGEMVASEMRRAGSAVNTSVRASFGSQPVLVGR